MLNEAYESKSDYHIEFRLLLRPSRTYRWVVANAKAVKDESNNVKAWVGTLTDINDSKITYSQAEERFEREIQSNIDKIRELEAELAVHRTNNE